MTDDRNDQNRPLTPFESARLDADLNSLRPPPPSDALRRRVADLGSGRDIPPAVVRLRRPPVWRLAAIAASLLLAFAVGLLLPSPLRTDGASVSPIVDVDPSPAEIDDAPGNSMLTDLALVDVADQTSSTDQLPDIPLQ